MSRLIISIFLSVFFFTTIPFNATAGDVNAVQRVDLINIVAYVQNKTLRISPIYINKATDRIVNWDTRKVSCSFVVYKIKGSLIDEEKGDQIISGDKTLTRSSQDFYVNIPESYLDGSWAIIECKFDTWFKSDLIASETFRLKKN